MPVRPLGILFEENWNGKGQLFGMFKFMKTAKDSSLVRIPESAGEDANSFDVMDKNRISFIILPNIFISKYKNFKINPNSS